MKTVKCPACGAEQAIAREEDNKMHCAFCSQEIELPDYEEGEAEYATENGNRTIKPVGDCISAEYILKREEVDTALTASGKLGKRKSILWIETILLIVLALAMAFSIYAGSNGLLNFKAPGKSSWFMLALSVILIPLVWIMPKINKKKIIDASTTGAKITLEIYQNVISIGSSQSESWQLDLSEGYRLLEEPGLMVLILNNGQVFPIPDRAFADINLAQAKAIIKEHAHKEDK